MRRVIGVLIALATTIAVLTPSASAQESGPGASDQLQDNPVVLVMDTSGSMNDGDGTGRRKIEGARAAMTDFVRALPPRTPIGLRAYPGRGTQRREGCSAGDELVELRRDASADLSRVDAEIRSLTANGETPTAAALEQAAEDVRGFGDESATIVLVSDGESNCGADPCEVARQIEASGIAVTVNTVGFQISSKGKAELQCIAEAVHGRYSDVADSQELAETLGRLARPLVEVRLEYPASVHGITGQDGTGVINVVADVTVLGALAVRDVRVAMTFGSPRSPAVLSPRRRLGNLQPGQTSKVLWTFRSPIEPVPLELAFTVTASGANSPSAAAVGSIMVTPGYDSGLIGPILRDKQNVVILGDSFSSGEGGGEYSLESNREGNRCHRSPNTYGVELLGGLRALGGRVDNVACSGALTRDLVLSNPNNDYEPPQFSHLEDRAYDLALMTIGGNDLGFGDFIIRCLVTVDCADADPWPLRQQFNDGLGALARDLPDRIQAAEEALNHPRHLKDRGGPAPLVVLSYPSLVPMGPSKNTLFCSAVFDPDELAFFQEFSLSISAVIRQAVGLLRAEGRPVYFAPDVIDALQPDHSYCSGQPWLHTLDEFAGPVAIAAAKAAAARWTGLPIFSFLPVCETLRDAEAAQDNPDRVCGHKELMHPKVEGYDAMTARLVRWSTSPDAREPITRKPHLSVSAFTKARRNPVIATFLSDGTGTHDPLQVQPADTVTIQGSGMEPGSSARVVLESEPRILADLTADQSGAVTVDVLIPSALPIGEHHLFLLGTRPDGQPMVTERVLNVRRPRPGAVPAAGTLGLASLLLGGVLARRPTRQARTREKGDGQ